MHRAGTADQFADIKVHQPKSFELRSEKQLQVIEDLQ